MWIQFSDSELLIKIRYLQMAIERAWGNHTAFLFCCLFFKKDYLAWRYLFLLDLGLFLNFVSEQSFYFFFFPVQVEK